MCSQVFDLEKEFEKMSPFNKSSLEIQGAWIGAGHPCFVIAEAGLNHNGDLEIARRLIDAAVICGADAIKFQKRTVDTLAIQSVLDAADDRFTGFGKTYRQIREYLEFGWDEYVELKHYCDERQIVFLCTAFDVEAADFLERLSVPAFKVASHSLTNLPLLDHLATIGKPVIMSTGMCTLDEIDEAVGVFQRCGSPVVLLHCVSSYPQPVEESNLAMITVLRDRYDIPVGYSGHEMGYLPTLTGVALGAAAVERHITLNKNLIGFDHKLSLEPDELFGMVRDIRAVERAMGTGEKTVSETEMITRRKYHVSIVAMRDIRPGQTITKSMLSLKNPGTGLPARCLDDVIGKKARVFIPADALLDFESLEPDEVKRE